MTGFNWSEIITDWGERDDMIEIYVNKKIDEERKLQKDFSKYKKN